MARKPNSTTSGGPFDSEIIVAVLEKAEDIPGFKYFKNDICGALIQVTKYGKKGKFGWEIDHIKPVSKGGTDDLDNLQALHWKNNRHKGNNWPDWKCKKKS